MRSRWLRLSAALFFLALPSGLLAEAPEAGLTLERALALARERGVGLALARGRVAEAGAREAQAGRRFQAAPTVEVDGGYRRAESDFLDFSTVVTQDLDPGRQHAARLAGATASREQAEAELAEARRRLLLDVESAFARGLAAEERVRLLRQNREAADALLAATERRTAAGEGTALEQNRARTAAASARAELGAAEAARSLASAELSGFLGLPEPVAAVGTLDRGAPPDLGALLSGLDRRPDVQALAAALRAAEAEALLGRALARPELGVRGGVGREEGADLVTAGVVVTLPVHGRGREALATGEARATALRQALADALAAAEAEVRGAHAALTQRLAALRELAATALPALADNESLAQKSFEAGEINLGELLLLRREILETRLSHLDRLLEAALTRATLAAAAGELR